MDLDAPNVLSFSNGQEFFQAWSMRQLISPTHTRTDTPGSGGNLGAGLLILQARVVLTELSGPPENCGFNRQHLFWGRAVVIVVVVLTFYVYSSHVYDLFTSDGRLDGGSMSEEVEEEGREVQKKEKRRQVPAQ